MKPKNEERQEFDSIGSCIGEHPGNDLVREHFNFHWWSCSTFQCQSHIRLKEILAQTIIQNSSDQSQIGIEVAIGKMAEGNLQITGREIGDLLVDGSIEVASQPFVLLEIVLTSIVSSQLSLAR
jgi:hypothetical protein